MLEREKPPTVFYEFLFYLRKAGLFTAATALPCIVVDHIGKIMTRLGFVSTNSDTLPPK